jgi:hypothetical protein
VQNYLTMPIKVCPVDANAKAVAVLSQMINFICPNPKIVTWNPDNGLSIPQGLALGNAIKNLAIS